MADVVNFPETTPPVLEGNQRLDPTTLSPTEIINRLMSTAAIQKVAFTLGSGVGGGSIILDAPNNRIIINDGSVDRVLIGYQAGGF